MAETLLDAATKLVGSITSDDDLRIEGVVEGGVTTRGKLVLAERGTIKGRVAGRDVEVHGTVEGDVEATGQLLLGPTGRIQGDVRAAHMRVEDGGVLQGKVATSDGRRFSPSDRG